MVTALTLTLIYEVSGRGRWENLDDLLRRAGNAQVGRFFGPPADRPGYDPLLRATSRDWRLMSGVVLAADRVARM